MLFKDLIPGQKIPLPDGGEFDITSYPHLDSSTGSLYVDGFLSDGTESKYFATENSYISLLT